MNRGRRIPQVVRRSRSRNRLRRIKNVALYDVVHGPTWAFFTFCHVNVSCTPIKQVRPSPAVHENSMSNG